MAADDAVRTTFNHYVQEEEALSNMVWFGMIVSKNATQEALKAIPGDSVAYTIATKSVQDFNNSDKLEVDAKAANMLTLEKEATENSKLHEQAQTNMPGADLKASNTANSHPVVKMWLSEDVIIMIKEFLGEAILFPLFKAFVAFASSV